MYLRMESAPNAKANPHPGGHLSPAASLSPAPTSLNTGWSPSARQRPFWTEITACLRVSATTTWTPTTSPPTDDRGGNRRHYHPRPPWGALPTAQPSQFTARNPLKGVAATLGGKAGVEVTPPCGCRNGNRSSQYHG